MFNVHACAIPINWQPHVFFILKFFNFTYISVAETKLLEEEVLAAVEKVLDDFEG